MEIGDVFTFARTFSEEETLQFAALTGDKGKHHMERDDQGRRMVHGLFTATIPTKIGGDLNYIAKEMVLEFHRPVFTGDTITAKLTITEMAQMEGFRKISMRSVCLNQHGKEVASGYSHGIIRD